MYTLHQYNPHDNECIAVPMSVYDAYVEELLGYKKREVEARIHSFSLPSPSNDGKGAIEKMKGIVVMHLHEHSKGITQFVIMRYMKMVDIIIID